MSGPTITIQPGLWGRRFEVRVDPPRADFPLRTFGDHAKASAYAEALAQERGWSIVDQCQPAERES